MLFNEVNEFNWTVDNFGTSFTETAPGTGMTTGAANTKGTAVELLPAVAEDIYGISILFLGGGVSGTAHLFMADLLTDEAGGSSYTVKIANLMSSNPSFLYTGVHYYFPIYIPAGSSIGMQAQSATATQTLRCAIRAYGKPSHPHLLNVGTRVETLGADTATTTGTGITPGNSVLGAFTASLGATANDNWWWQLGIVNNDATITSAANYYNVKAGNGTNDKMCIEGILSTGSASEQLAKQAFGRGIPIRRIVAGSNVYVQAANILAAPDTGISVCAYALG